MTDLMQNPAAAGVKTGVIKVLLTFSDLVFYDIIQILYRAAATDIIATEFHIIFLDHSSKSLN